MSRDISPLDSLEIASPCSADWDAMQGDDRVRHCGQCMLNVYNLSELPEREALELVSQHEGRLCVRLYKRADGTVITRDCPVGLRALRKNVVRMLAATVAFLVGLMFANFALSAVRSSGPGKSRLGTLIYGVFSEDPLGQGGGVLMGRYCPLPTPATGPAAGMGAGPGVVDPTDPADLPQDEATPTAEAAE